MSVDEFLTKLWKNKEVRWEIIIIGVSGACSVLCGLFTQNIVFTVIYVAITAVIDIISVIEEKMEGLVDWKKYFSGLFEMKNYGKYLVFGIFSLLPVLFGIATKEIVLRGIKDVPSILFVNIFPNLSGAFIVCSLLAHISKWDQKQFIEALVRSKRGLFNVIIRVSFFACYLNAVSYRADDSWKYANYVNSAYLFFIISYGAVAVVSFISRFIDAQPFPYTIKKSFPVQTMFISALFLFSCGAAPLIGKVGKHEPILLLLNTITAITILGFLLKFMDRKADTNGKIYPIWEVAAFLVFVILNCLANFWMWDGTGDKISQAALGILILTITIVILLYLNHLQGENLRKLQETKSGVAIP